MKKLITLYGAAETGKTTTIKLVDELLSVLPLSTERHASRKIYGKDFLVIFDVDRVAVGVCSQGDSWGHLGKHLKSLLDEGCEIIVCPTRTSGSTVKGVEKLAGVSIKWIEQTCISHLKDWLDVVADIPATDRLRNRSNRRTANHVVRLVEDHLVNLNGKTL